MTGACRQDYDSIAKATDRQNAAANGVSPPRFALLMPGSDVVVDVCFGFANLALSFAPQLLAFALELFARVARQPADGVSNPAFGFLSEAFDLVFQAFAVEIVCHFLPP